MRRHLDGKTPCVETKRACLGEMTLSVFMERHPVVTKPQRVERAPHDVESQRLASSLEAAPGRREAASRREGDASRRPKDASRRDTDASCRHDAAARRRAHPTRPIVIEDATMTFSRWAGAAALVATVLAACYSQPNTDDCSPGFSYACSGDNGCNGFQVCNGTGTGYGECVCGAPGDAAAADATTEAAAMDSSAAEASGDVTTADGENPDASAGDASSGDAKSADSPTDVAAQ
jgi:hypothetical protein